MFCNDRRRLDDFHLLEHFRLAPRKDQPTAAVRAAVERVGLEVVDRLRWERGPQVLLVSGLSALLSLLPTFGSRLLRLNDVARRRLGGGRGVLPRGGQFLFQPGNLFMQPGVFFFQLRVTFHHPEQLFLQPGHALGQPVTLTVETSFPQLHRAGRYASPTVQSRPIDCLPKRRILANSWGEGGLDMAPSRNKTQFVRLPP